MSKYNKGHTYSTYGCKQGPKLKTLPILSAGSLKSKFFVLINRFKPSGCLYSGDLIVVLLCITMTWKYAENSA